MANDQDRTSGFDQDKQGSAFGSQQQQQQQQGQKPEGEIKDRAGQDSQMPSADNDENAATGQAPEGGQNPDSSFIGSGGSDDLGTESLQQQGSPESGFAEQGQGASNQSDIEGASERREDEDSEDGSQI